MSTAQDILRPASAQRPRTQRTVRPQLRTGFPPLIGIPAASGAPPAVRRPPRRTDAPLVRDGSTVRVGSSKSLISEYAHCGRSLAYSGPHPCWVCQPRRRHASPQHSRMSSPNPPKIRPIMRRPRHPALPRHPRATRVRRCRSGADGERCLGHAREKGEDS